jgi:hypothetical protein
MIRLRLKPDAEVYDGDLDSDHVFKHMGRFRKILRDRGFEASDIDIASAYSEWAEWYWACGWIEPVENDSLLFCALMTELEPVE